MGFFDTAKKVANAMGDSAREMREESEKYQERYRSYSRECNHPIFRYF